MSVDQGETSGNFLEVVDMLPDCDADTLLIKAVPAGPVCHRGTEACFDTPESEGFARRLARIVHQRHLDMPDNSYTTRLFIKGVKKIAQKVGEEAVESAIEAVDGNRPRFIYEAADLLYHYFVLLEQMDCSIDDIERSYYSDTAKHSFARTQDDIEYHRHSHHRSEGVDRYHCVVRDSARHVASQTQY